MRRLLLVLVPAFGLVGAVFVVTVGAPWVLARQHFPTDTPQPMVFNHEMHVQAVGADCAFCHRTANQGDSAGLPDVEQCMFCHVAVGDREDVQGQRAGIAAGIQELRQSWQERRPIDWLRIHHVPDHTRFPHDAHVNSSIPCATCHGDVGSMRQTRQVRSLKMADCVACHQETGAPTTCGACHY